MLVIEPMIGNGWLETGSKRASAPTASDRNIYNYCKVIRVSEHKTLRFDGVKYYIPHGARAVTIDGEKHYLCVPVKGRGAVRAVRACEVDGLSAVAPNGKGHVPYAHEAMSPLPALAPVHPRFQVRAFERRWLAILAATLALLATLLGCR